MHDLANDVSFGINSLRQRMIGKRLLSAVEQTEDMVIITDILGVVQYANHAFVQETGYSLDEIIGKNVSILRSDKISQSMIDELWQTITEGKTWKGRFVNKRKNGSLFEVDTSISPVRNTEGKVENYVGVYRDVTKEVLMEKQLRQSQKMEAIGTLTCWYCS